MFKKLKQFFGVQETSKAEPVEARTSPDVEPAPNSASIAAESLKNQADNLLRSGALLEAEQCYQEAIKVKPGYADAYINLSIALRMQQRYEDAANMLEQAFQINPGDVYIHYNLGVLAKVQGRHELAISHFLKVLAMDANMLDAYYDLADTYLNKGDKASARALASRAAEKFPQEADLAILIANIDAEDKQYDLALENYYKVLQLKPGHADALWHVSWILQKQDKLLEAEASYHKLIAIAPERHEAHYNLGTVLNSTGKKKEAIASYHKALAIKPDSGNVYHNLGKAYEDLAKLDEAEASFRKGATLSSNVQSWSQVSLGNLLRDTGRLAEAVTYYKAATLTDPNYLEAHSSLLFNLCFGDLCTAEEYKKEINIYHAKLAARAQTYTAWQCRPAHQEQRKLRVGMVSGDFGLHPVGLFLENVINHISLQHIEFFAYSSKARNDALMLKLKSYFSKWTSIEEVDDETAARLIHEDGVDILIDLAGHTVHNRLPIFAYKPAPVQASWLGYFATTGVPGMDYLLADKISVPPAHTEYFTEQIWHMPETRLCFSPPKIGADAIHTQLPALRNGYLTFGCFQNISKINDVTLELWGRIFTQIPTARMRYQCWQLDSDTAREKMRASFARHGIAAERVTLLGPANRDAYLAAHAEVDLILDTFPYAGGTTTCEALAMGVPTISLAGHTMSSLQGASLMSYAGLPDWVASSGDDYVQKAIRHTENLEQLSHLRAGLRERVLASPLYDGASFAINLENALQAMWDKYVNSSGA